MGSDEEEEPSCFVAVMVLETVGATVGIQKNSLDHYLKKQHQQSSPWPSTVAQIPGMIMSPILARIVKPCDKFRHS